MSRPITIMSPAPHGTSVSFMVQRGDPPACYYFVYTSLYKNYVHKMASSISHKSFTIRTKGFHSHWQGSGTQPDMFIFRNICNGELVVRDNETAAVSETFRQVCVDWIGSFRIDILICCKELGVKFKQLATMKYSLLLTFHSPQRFFGFFFSNLSCIITTNWFLS